MEQDEFMKLLSTYILRRTATGNGDKIIVSRNDLMDFKNRIESIFFEISVEGDNVIVRVQEALISNIIQ